MSRADLLNDMAAMLSKKCLSDLHGLDIRELKKIMNRLDAEKYTSAQWSYALSYISGKDVVLDNIENLEKLIAKL